MSHRLFVRYRAFKILKTKKSICATANAIYFLFRERNEKDWKRWRARIKKCASTIKSIFIPIQVPESGYADDFTVRKIHCRSYANDRRA